MPRGRRKKIDDATGAPLPVVDEGVGADVGGGVSVADKDDVLMSVKEFVGADGSEGWRDVHWVYNNLWVKEVEAGRSECGAWFWLMDCRRSSDARAKFRDYT